MRYRKSKHAEDEIIRRGIPESVVDDILQNPEQVIEMNNDTKIYQSRIDLGKGKIYLIRAIINDSIDPGVVITVYKTSKIEKYWRK